MKKIKHFILLTIFLFGMSFLTSCDSLLKDPSEESGGNNSIQDTDKREALYKLATESGYTGTYEEWLESIKGDFIELSVTETHIVWKYASESVWRNLVELSKFAGTNGTNGVDGTDGKNGTDGKTPEFRVNEGYLEWKYTTDTEWIKLYEVEEKEEKEYYTVTLILNDYYNGMTTEKSIQVEKGELITNIWEFIPEGYKIENVYFYDSVRNYHIDWLFDIYTVNKDMTLCVNMYKTHKITLIRFDGNVYEEYEYRHGEYFWAPSYINGSDVEWYYDQEFTKKFGGEYIYSDITLYAKEIKVSDYFIVLKDSNEFKDEYRIANYGLGSSNYINVYLEAGTEFVLMSEDMQKVYNNTNCSFFDLSDGSDGYFKVNTSGLYHFDIDSYARPYESCNIYLVDAYEKATPETLIKDHFLDFGGNYWWDYSNDALTLSKHGDEWSNLRSTVSANEIIGYNKLVVEICGQKDEKIMFKVADRKEFWVTCDGTKQYFEFDFTDLVIDNNFCALYIFANGGNWGTGNKFYITQLHFKKDFSNILMADTGNGIKYGTYDENACYIDVVLKPGDYLKLSLDNKNINDFAPTFEGDYTNSIDNYQNYQLLGSDGEFVLPSTSDRNVKYNIKYDFNSKILSITANPLENTSDLISTGFVNLDEGVYSIETSENYMSFQKGSSGHEWSCIKSNLMGSDIVGCTKLIIKVKGTAGENCLVKINDYYQGETFIYFDGTEQTFELDINFTIDESKPALILFANAGISGSSSKVEVFELYFK